MNVGLDVAGCPHQFEVVVRRQSQHEINGADHVTIKDAMLCSDAEPAVAGRQVNAVLAQPDVDVMNLAVSVAELD